MQWSYCSLALSIWIHIYSSSKDALDISAFRVTGILLTFLQSDILTLLNVFLMLYVKFNFTWLLALVLSSVFKLCLDFESYIMCIIYWLKLDILKSIRKWPVNKGYSEQRYQYWIDWNTPCPQWGTISTTSCFTITIWSNDRKMKTYMFLHTILVSGWLPPLISDTGKFLI